MSEYERVKALIPPALDDLEEVARLEVTRARRDLPERDPAMFDCWLGGAVRELDPFTEADPLAVLVTLIAYAGAYLGDGPHLRAGDDRHPLLVWPLVIGRTSSGRKGASWSTGKRLFHATAPEFTHSTEGNTRSGLTSGEGLAAMFAEDDQDQGEAGPQDTEAGGRKPRRPAGALPAGDKRLLVFEAEWGAVMARMKREGNSLSAMLRSAWEGGDLSTMNVAARHAPESHIAVVAHITPKEFQAKLSASDMAGGTYNRFLPVYVARSKFLPNAAGADPQLVTELGAALRKRLHHAMSFSALGFTAEGLKAWRRLYVEFGTDHGDDGPIEQFISRTAPYCLRIAAIHAVIDGSNLIKPEHLTASAALVRYAIASARAVFASNPTLARLAAWIEEAGSTGRTKEEIRAGFFGGNTKAADIRALLDQLTQAGKTTPTTRPRADGKPGRGSEAFVSTQVRGLRGLRG